jgi:choline dehydrogenase-like flavoprotein
MGAPAPHVSFLAALNMLKEARDDLRRRSGAGAPRVYTNPLGVQLGQCTYCGFCEKFGRGNYSKASPQTTILPVLMQRPNFTLPTNCEVLKVDGG